MALPSRDLGDLLAANWAESVLLFPEVQQPPFSLEGVFHVDVQSFLIVAFPCGVIRVGFSLDFHVPFDWHVGGLGQVYFLVVYLCVEHPVVPFDGCEVFLPYPFVGFRWVSSFGPPSYELIDGTVYRVERVLTYHMLVILRPSSNDRVESPNEFSSGDGFVFLHDAPKFLQVGLYRLLGWFHQQFGLFSRFVLAYVLTQKVKSLFNMRDDGFFWGQFESSFAHEVLHKRFHLLFEQFFRCPCDQKVVGVSDEIDLRVVARFRFGEGFL